MPRGVGDIFIHTLHQRKVNMEKRNPHGVEYFRELKSLQKKIIFTGFILWKDVKGRTTLEETILHTLLLNKANIDTSFTPPLTQVHKYIQFQPWILNFSLICAHFVQCDQLLEFF